MNKAFSKDSKILISKTSRSKSSVSYTDAINAVFKLLDVNNDGIVCHYDLNILKDSIKKEKNADFDLTGIEKKLSEREIDLAQLLFLFKNSHQLIKNMISLYETKLEKINQIKNKYLNELDYNNIFLHVIVTNRKDKLQKELTIPLKGLKEPIKIPEINQSFDIENHFEYLFLNDDSEYFAEFDGNTLTCNFEYNENMNDAEREKMNKLKMSLTSLTTKSNKIKDDKKYYNDISDGLNNNNSGNKSLDFLSYLNKLFLVNSVDEDEHFNNSIDNSFMSSRSGSRNLFKSKVNRDDSFNKLNDSINKQKSFNLSKEILDTSITGKVDTKRGCSTMINLQSVVEESNNLIDDKLKRLVDSHKVANSHADLMKKGSIRSLLSIAINSTYVFTSKKSNKFDVCREYMKYLQ